MQHVVSRGMWPECGLYGSHQHLCWCAEGAHPALLAWHAEWVIRQYHIMFAILKQFCSGVPEHVYPPQLWGYLLMEGAASAALQRQNLVPQLASVNTGVVLDTSVVADGLWLGTLLKTEDGTSRCDTSLLSC
jgi:hypothetical protein